MRRSILSLSLILLGFVASAALDSLPRQLSLARLQHTDLFHLRWANVTLDILFAIIVLFMLWWATIKNKPGRVLSVLLVLIGAAALLLSSMMLYALPRETLDNFHVPSFFSQFYLLVCAPNNIYTLSYSGMIVLIGIGGLVKLQPYVTEKPLSFPLVIIGAMLSFGVDLIHQFALEQVDLMNIKFLVMFPVENLLFAFIFMFIARWLLIFNKPTKLTLVSSLVLGIGLLLYKTSLPLNFPYLMPTWYARQQLHSVCSPFSFTVTYGGLIAVVSLIGLFRNRLPSNFNKTSLN